MAVAVGRMVRLWLTSRPRRWFSTSVAMSCRRLFNIFHPYDPVAFRLEPLLREDNGVPMSGKAGAREGNLRKSSPGHEEPVILPTWTGGLRVHYQVQRWWHELWERACDAKRSVEESIEHSLEAIGLIDEQHDGSRGGEDSRDEESLFGPSSDTSLEAVEHALEEASIRAKAAGKYHEATAAEESSVSNTVASLVLPESQDGAATATAAIGQSLLTKHHQQQQRSLVEDERDVEECPDAACLPTFSGEARAGTDEKKGQGRRGKTIGGRDRSVGEERPPASDGGLTGLEWMGAVMEEDVERNGAIAGGRRVDYCLQEKEFEVTNEYIFALGSHVIYWSSKDVSLFVAQQVFADALVASKAPGLG